MEGFLFIGKVITVATVGLFSQLYSAAEYVGSAMVNQAQSQEVEK